MRTLPNGLTVFNGTPHSITFWQDGWANTVAVETDEIISATIEEQIVSINENILLVTPTFVGTSEGHTIIEQAITKGADLIVGSIIAAQAYPGLVVAMTPAPGYERVPPAEKRMNPDKFTMYEHTSAAARASHERGPGRPPTPPTAPAAAGGGDGSGERSEE